MGAGWVGRRTIGMAYLSGAKYRQHRRVWVLIRAAKTRCYGDGPLRSKRGGSRAPARATRVEYDDVASSPESACVQLTGKLGYDIESSCRRAGASRHD
jgi:hypothetical protein